MAFKKYSRNRKTWKEITKRERQKILIIGLISLAVVLLALAALYVFVWRQPKQPKHPDEMVILSPIPEPNKELSLPSPTAIATTQPVVTPKPVVIQDSFNDLYEENSDIVGWIKVDNTDIDYPIVQAKDNSFYMDKDFYKEYSYPGSIFLDFRCDFRNMYMSAHQIVYGHNMKNGTMFQQLTKYQDEDFFKENRYININTLYGNYVFEVFSAYETPISFYYLETGFEDKEDWLEFIKVFQEKSDFKTNIKLSGKEVVLTLSTCTNRHDKNYRYVVHARLTNPEQYDMIYDYIY